MTDYSRFTTAEMVATIVQAYEDDPTNWGIGSFGNVEGGNLRVGMTIGLYHRPDRFLVRKMRGGQFRVTHLFANREVGVDTDPEEATRKAMGLT